MKRIARVAGAAFLLALAVDAAGAQEPPRAQPKVVLVELFTSEGCSSCPPADAVLARLNGTRADDGTLIVGLSEHVTYWNRLGWEDPFSQDLFTERQQRYGQRMGRDDVYTPQAVVGGERAMVGSDERAIVDAVKREAGRSSGVGLKIVSANAMPSGVRVEFTLSGKVPKSAEVYGVVAQDAAVSRVQRGENGGRTLRHVSAVRSLTLLRKLDGAAIHSVELPASEGSAGGQHVVLFVQDAGLGRVLAVDARAF